MKAKDKKEVIKTLKSIHFGKPLIDGTKMMGIMEDLQKKEEIKTRMKEGIKYDQEKPRIAEMIIDFKDSIEALTRIWEFGANKYAKSNWKQLDNGIDRYTNAMLRHLLAEDTNRYDDETKLLHAAHIAFNALARLHFILEEEKNKKV